MDKHEISLRLQEIINMHKMNPSQYAKFAGISRSTLEGYLKETSSLQIKALEKICEKSKISADYLLFGKLSNNTNIPIEDRELLSLFNELNSDEKKICLAYLKGFIDNERRHTAVSDPQIKIVGK